MRTRKPWTQEQTQEISEAMKSARFTREHRRLQAIYLYSIGKEVGEISQITQLTPVSISRLYSKYRSEGLNAIPDAPRTGRPHYLTTEQEGTIKDMVLHKTPADMGFTANFNWTAGIVAEYILKEFNIHFTVKGATKLLKRLNLSFTRPTYTLANADSQKQEQFREEFAIVKKTWKQV